MYYQDPPPPPPPTTRELRRDAWWAMISLICATAVWLGIAWMAWEFLCAAP
jgi:hypothetical protein